MLHTIENERLTCTIDSNGAEIRSLKNKATNQEYIWQINKSIWGGSSPVLFPCIANIKDGKVVFNGKDYPMPKHGIIRHNNSLKFEQHKVSKCAFTLESSAKTLTHYPFKFTFTVTYELIDNRLIMTYNIKNRDSVSMHFACGGHTAYSCPINENTKLSDYVIEFPAKFDFVANTLGATGLLSNRKRNIESNENILSLSDTIFNEDSLIFSDIDFDWVRFRKKNEKKGVIVRFKDYPNLALWAKPGADYVCIEPWLGLPDHENESNDLTQKTSFKAIKPSTEFTIAIETEIE